MHADSLTLSHCHLVLSLECVTLSTNNQQDLFKRLFEVVFQLLPTSKIEISIAGQIPNFRVWVSDPDDLLFASQILNNATIDNIGKLTCNIKQATLNQKTFQSSLFFTKENYEILISKSKSKNNSNWLETFSKTNFSVEFDPKPFSKVILPKFAKKETIFVSSETDLNHLDSKPFKSRQILSSEITINTPLGFKAQKQPANTLLLNDPPNTLSLIEQIRVGRQPEETSDSKFWARAIPEERTSKSNIGGKIAKVNSGEIFGLPILTGSERETKSSMLPIKKTKVALISNLHKFFDSAEQIYNLCNSFGKIRGVAYMANLQIVLVEYLTEDAVDRCIKNINNECVQELKFHASISRKYKSVKRETDISKTKSEKFNNYVFPLDQKERHLIDRQVFSDISLNVLVSFVELESQENSKDQLVGFEQFGEKGRYDWKDGDNATNQRVGVYQEEIGLLNKKVFQTKGVQFYQERVEKIARIERVLQRLRLGENCFGFIFRMGDISSAVKVVSRLNGSFEDSLRWKADFYN